MSLDCMFVPPGTKADIQVFSRPSTVTNLQWYNWIKPRGFVMCSIVAIGGGGGGGGGFVKTAGNAGGGGGGGGAGARTRFVGPLCFLPDRLFVQVGAGGTGSVSGGSATAGIVTYVSVHNHTTANNVVLTANAGGAAGTGTASAAGNGGNGGTASSITTMCFGGRGFFMSIAGLAGSQGGAHTGAVGTSTSFSSSNPMIAATGGGGSTAAAFDGGLITALGGYASEQRPSTSLVGEAGASGAYCPTGLFFVYGGLGGASSNTISGGNGGNGVYGSGGGGGGAGITPSSKGGNGGNGLVIITCW